MRTARAGVTGVSCTGPRTPGSLLSLLVSASATARPPLRRWQRRALALYLRSQPQDFLAVATPGAGKTAFALTVAAELMRAGTVRALTVVAPTEHLKGQWATTAAQFGISLDPGFVNRQGASSSDFDGVVVTYAQVAAHPALHRARTQARRTFVILDEIHHAGDALSWGAAVRDAFAPAVRRLALTGTPFRSDEHPIPFIRYERGRDGLERSAADVSYGYGDALADGVVRPVVFLAYSGQTRWRTRAGDEVTATLGEPLTGDVTARAWRTALDPAGDWIPAVLHAADTRLSQLRAAGTPDAGGLVIATDQAAARAYARHLREVTGTAPVVVLSDEHRSSRRIAAFASSKDRWMVAVRMVSEGVDVPRLAVGVYATNAATPLYFAQAVGRFVRSRRAGETASIFLPSVPVLLRLAGEIEVTRDHVLGAARDGEEMWDDTSLARANAEATEPDDAGFEALEASAHLDQVIYEGASFGPGASDEDADFVGLPGLLTTEQVSVLLAQRDRSRLPPGSPAPVRPGPSPHEVRSALRRELSLLVAARHHRTGAAHGAIHAQLQNECGGPPTALATMEQLRGRIDTLRMWAVAAAGRTDR